MNTAYAADRVWHRLLPQAALALFLSGLLILWGGETAQAGYGDDGKPWTGTRVGWGPTCSGNGWNCDWIAPSLAYSGRTSDGFSCYAHINWWKNGANWWHIDTSNSGRVVKTDYVDGNKYKVETWKCEFTHGGQVVYGPFTSYKRTENHEWQTREYYGNYDTWEDTCYRYRARRTRMVPYDRIWDIWDWSKQGPLYYTDRQVTETRCKDPTVSISGPYTRYRGETATFTASGSQPQGLAVTYSWSPSQSVTSSTPATRYVTVTARSNWSGTYPWGGTVTWSGQASASSSASFMNRAPSVSISCTSPVSVGQSSSCSASGSDPDGDSLSYGWSPSKNPSWPSPGTYTVTVTATDGYGGSATASTTVTVQPASSSPSPPANRRPTVSISCPSSVPVGSTAACTASGSDPDGDSLTFAWRDGGSGTSRNYTISHATSYTVYVTGCDPSGACDTAYAEITGYVPNNAPTVNLSCPSSVQVGGTATCTATASDPDGDAVTLTWSEGSSGPTKNYSWPTPGSKFVYVTGCDPQGACRTATATISVYEPNRAPTVSISPRNPIIDVNAAQLFRAEGSDPDGDALTYTWSVTGSPTINGAGQTRTISWDAPGTYTVTVTVSDGRGGAASDTASVTVTETVTIGSAVASPNPGMRGQRVKITIHTSGEVEGVMVDLPAAFQNVWVHFGDGSPPIEVKNDHPTATEESPGSGIWTYQFVLPWTRDRPADDTYTIVITATGPGGTATYSLEYKVEGHLELWQPTGFYPVIRPY